MDRQEVGCGGIDWINLAQDECGNEPSDCMKCGEFIDQLRTGQILKKDFTPCRWLIGWWVGSFVRLLVRSFVCWVVVSLVTWLLS